MRILIAEDDTNTANGLAEVLQREGYQTITAGNGKEALRLYQEMEPSIVCLDIMMPAMSGYDVCREIRKLDSQIPILFISAKSEEIDTVIGLELGADDFIIKPFGVKAVVARIRAVVRRCYASGQIEKTPPFHMCDLRIEPSELRAYRNDIPIDLSLRDCKILELLFKNKGKAVDRNTLFDTCWGIDYLPSSRSLDQHISQLRKKIEQDPQQPKIITTIHAVGYRYDQNVLD